MVQDTVAVIQNFGHLTAKIHRDKKWVKGKGTRNEFLQLRSGKPDESDDINTILPKFCKDFCEALENNTLFDFLRK